LTSYVEDLQTRRLQLVKERDSKRETSDMYLPSQPEKSTGVKGSGGVHVRSVLPPSRSEQRSGFEQKFINFETNHENTLFFGATSTIAHLENVRNGKIIPEIPAQLTSFSAGLELPSLSRSMLTHHPDLPPLSTCLSLVDVFSNSINILYPVSSPEGLKAICASTFNEGPLYPERLDVQTLYIILAISLHLLSKNDHSLSTAADAYFHLVHRSANQMSSLVQRNNLEPLRIAILVATYLMLRPKSGNLWRVVGFCSRLCLGMVNLPRGSKKEEAEYQVLFKTLLCIDW
jgi:hypothetical protein